MGKLLALLVLVAIVVLVYLLVTRAIDRYIQPTKRKAIWEPDFKELDGHYEVFITNGLKAPDRREIFVEKVPGDDSLAFDVAMGLAEERADAKNRRNKNKWQRLLN